MKNVMTRIFSLCLSFVIMVCILAPTSFAYENTHYDVNPKILPMDLSINERLQIQEDIGELKKAGIISKNYGEIISIEHSSDGYQETTRNHMIYTIGYDSIINTVCIVNETSNEITFKISQDNIENIVTFAENDIILDGTMVEYSLNKAASLPEMERRVSDRFFQVACPYGEESEYNKYAYSKEDANINLGNPIIDLTVGAFLAVLEAIGETGWESFVQIAGNSLYYWLTTEYPNTSGISFKADLYHHESCGLLSGGHISDYGATVTKYDMTWYAEENFRGGTTSSVIYEIYRIY